MFQVAGTLFLHHLLAAAYWWIASGIAVYVGLRAPILVGLPHLETHVFETSTHSCWITDFAISRIG
jgi:hypothetical protein